MSEEFNLSDEVVDKVLRLNARNWTQRAID